LKDKHQEAARHAEFMGALRGVSQPATPKPTIAMHHADIAASAGIAPMTPAEKAEAERVNADVARQWAIRGVPRHRRRRVQCLGTNAGRAS
jgi:hypothetical protein